MTPKRGFKITVQCLDISERNEARSKLKFLKFHFLALKGDYVGMETKNKLKMVNVLFKAVGLPQLEEEFETKLRNIWVVMETS